MCVEHNVCAEASESEAGGGVPADRHADCDNATKTLPSSSFLLEIASTLNAVASLTPLFSTPPPPPFHIHSHFFSSFSLYGMRVAV